MNPKVGLTNRTSMRKIKYPPKPNTSAASLFNSKRFYHSDQLNSWLRICGRDQNNTQLLLNWHKHLVISPPSSELSQIEFKSMQNESTSLGMAQAALRTVADDHFPLALNYGVSSGKSNRQKPGSDVVHPSSVFPNPVGDWSFITVHAPESVDRVQIEVRDEMGRIIQQDQLKGGVGYIPLSTAQMKRGVYLCSVFFDGIHVSTEKIIKF